LQLANVPLMLKRAFPTPRPNAVLDKSTAGQPDPRIARAQQRVAALDLKLYIMQTTGEFRSLPS